MSLICVTLMEREIDTLKEKIDQQKHLGASMMEIRADGLKNELSPTILEEILDLKQDIGIPIVLTIRPDWEGGDFKGDEELRSSLLEEAITLGFDYIDLEMRLEKALRDPLIVMAKEMDTKTIISYHDLLKTPSWSEIFAITKQCVSTGCDIAKVALTTKNHEDVLNVIKGGKAARDLNHKFTIMGMGPFGQYTRILAPYIGCELVYASLDADDKVDEGQLNLRTLLELWDALGTS